MGHLLSVVHDGVFCRMRERLFGPTQFTAYVPDAVFYFEAETGQPCCLAS